MPAIRQALETTRSARWYQEARSARREASWAGRARDYAALRAVLTARCGEGGNGRRVQPPVELNGLLTLVARQAHYAGAEPVYRRYRDKQRGQQLSRWAGQDPAVKPAAAFLAEAKIVAFWPYRAGVIDVADAFDMTPAEWAAAYLKALAAWVADDQPLAACRPAGAPQCVPEDMLVLARAATLGEEAGPLPPAPGCSLPVAARAARLYELAGHVLQTVLDDASITPLGAFNTVRDEVSALLTVPPASPADRLSQAIAEVSDQIIHAGIGASDGSMATADAGLTRHQAERLRSSLIDLAALLAGFAECAPADPASAAARES